MKVYRIKDWAKHYENNRTKEMRDMRWVPFPNTHDGEGYCQMVEGEIGAAILGAWVAAVQVASRCEPRGTLLRKSRTPYTATSLSVRTRLSIVAFEEMLRRASSFDIGWLEIVEVNETTGVISNVCETAGFPQAPAIHVGGGIPSIPSIPSFVPQEKKVKISPAGFLLFWRDWPASAWKVDKSQCEKFWRQNNCEDLTEKILSSIRQFKLTDGWKKEGGKFIPKPLKWLKAESWEAPIGKVLMAQKDAEVDAMLGITR